MNLNDRNAVYPIISNVQFWFSFRLPNTNYDSGIHYVQHFQAMLKPGVCELAHSFFHYLIMFWQLKAQVRF